MFIQVFYGTTLHVESWQHQIGDGGMPVAGESRLIIRNCSGVCLEQEWRAYSMCAHSDVHNEFAWDVSIC